MANSIAGNPKIFDTTGATSAITGPFKFRLIQWVDDNADVADNANLILTINGETVEATIQRAVTPDAAAVLWEIGPFDSGMQIDTFELTTMTAGHLHMWV